jgi:hypothetical protein
MSRHIGRDLPGERDTEPDFGIPRDDPQVGIVFPVSRACAGSAMKILHDKSPSHAGIKTGAADATPVESFVGEWVYLMPMPS